MESERNIQEDEINLLDLLKVIVKRKKLIGVTTLSAAIFSLVCSLLLPNIYTATATMLPPSKDAGGGLSALLGQAGGLAAMAGIGGLSGPADLYIGILKSRSVADAVIAKLDLMKELKAKTPDEARKGLESIVKVQAGKDGIITITADSKKPEMAAKLANAFVDELGRKSVSLNLTKAGSERVFLEKRLDVVKHELTAAENDLKDFEQKHKAFKVDSQASATIQGVASLQAEIAGKEVELAALRNTQTDENPQVATLKASISKLRSELARLGGQSGGGEGILPVGSLPTLGMEYIRKTRELKVQEAIFEQLTKQYEVAKLSEARDSSSLQVLDDAVVPSKKSNPKRALIVILATFTGFFLSIFASFALEFSANLNEEDRRRWQEIKRLATPKRLL